MKTTLTNGRHRSDAPRPAPGQTSGRDGGGGPIPWTWWIGGSVLLGAGLLLGIALLRWGAPHTGELALDEYLGARRVAALDAIAVAFGVLLGPIVAPLVLLVASLMVFRRHRPAAITLFTVTVVGWLSVGVGKLIFHRARPPFALVHALAFEGNADSFPSGHTAFGFALLFGVVLALRVARRRTWPAWVIGIPVALGVAASRVYAGVHYLGDVIAAPLFAAGAVALLVAAWLTVPQARRTAWAGRLFAAGRPRPS